MKHKVIFFFLISHCIAFAQNPIDIMERLDWNTVSQSRIHFEGASSSTKYSGCPIFRKEFEVEQLGTVSYNWISFEEESAATPIVTDRSKKLNLPKDYIVNTGVSTERGKHIAWIEIIPVKFISPEKYFRLKSFHINVTYMQGPAYTVLPEFANESVLRKGEFFKIACQESGIYKINKTLLEKITKKSASTINPKNIKLFGNSGRVLPEANDAKRIDDLAENTIMVVGENDGKFDDADYILFYANGPDTYFYDDAKLDFNYTKNSFDVKSYYFLTISDQPGLRIQTESSQNSPGKTFQSTLSFIHHQQDLSNLLEVDVCNEGSGKNWYGEELSNSRELDFKNEFTFNNIDLSQNATISLSFAAASSQLSSIKLIVDQIHKYSANLSSISESCTSNIASKSSIQASFLPQSDLINVLLQFPNVSANSDGWLDYLQITAYRNLVYNQKPMLIFNPAALTENTSRYEITAFNSNLMVWNITGLQSISQLTTEWQNSVLSFTTDNQYQHHYYYLFDPAMANLTPEVFEQAISNQNLHSFDNVDMVIVYHSNFKSEAERLKTHREKHSGLTILMANVQEIFNEFSSGSKDPTAIRDFARMLYTRNNRFKYLLLFGDASYDYRFIDKKYGDQDFIPTYETDESIDPIGAFPTDDYYGLLDPNEGRNLTGRLDISIGRLVSRTQEEAKNLVDKIIRYDTDPKLLEDWKLNLMHSADDEDSNVHLRQADFIANTISTDSKEFNQQKVYLDAYEQVTTPGGERYPEATKAIFSGIFQGSLIFTYLGHGGHTGLAQERVLQNTDIKNWDNFYKLPLVIVASCTFNGFDDPSKTNAGEEGLHNQLGGFLALYSTVRSVYSDDNFELTKSVFDYLFVFENDKPLTMGEILRRAKNDNSTSGIVENSRKFQLFGDPSQRLALPLLQNKVTLINDKDVTQKLDTFSALEKVKISGIVTDRMNNKMDNFNGTLYATVYDKEITLKTRANDPGSTSYDYKVQKNVIFKGLAEIKNGNWEFSFIVPKDINYDFGTGKISLYSSDGISRDASGYSDQLIIGGFSNDSLKDESPPIVEVFMNDDQFVSGGITNTDPKIFAKISDDFGINISGNSIGHDLTAVIDNNSQNPIILNNSFKTKLNDFRSGEVTYPLKSLTPGKHTLTITAWDVSNNMGQGSIDFIVIDKENITLDRILNYPNPFSNHTDFQFESNLGEAEVDVVIQIQTLSGKIVRSIQQTVSSTGFRFTGIPWDGKDEFGSSLANGVYLYRVTFNATIGSDRFKKRSDLQKLVILR